MTPYDHQGRSRRQFLRGIGRWAAAAGIAVVAAILAGRRLSAGGDARCDRTDPCSLCPSFDGCGLARATAARVTIEEAKGRG